MNSVQRRSVGVASIMLAITLAGWGCTSNPPSASQPPAADPVPARAALPPLPPIIVANPEPPTCQGAPAPATNIAMRDLFPGVRVDAAAKVVEFDSVLSPMLVPDPRAPLFFLETLACLPDTREHETLLVCRARPSHIHAALLLIGLVPGSPGGWRLVDDRLTPIDAAGDAVQIRFAYAGPDGAAREVDPVEWMVSARDERPFAEVLSERAAADGRPAALWVFAGSRMTTIKQPTEREVYDADESGVVIGLTSFGAELIALARTINPDAGVEEPEWIARMDRLPPAGTAITVRLRAAH